MKKTSFLAVAIGCVSILSSCGDNQETPAAAPASANAVIENIMTRTSIRQFTDKTVPKDTLDLLVKAGMAAPTAMNKQPWAFVVVSEKAALDSINANHPHANLKTAAAAIIVCGDMDKTLEGKGAEFWIQDCSAAAENILLAAHAYGLGAVWCSVYPSDERIDAVKKALELPDYITPLNLIALGYPDENPAPKDKWNPEAVHYQKW